MSKGKGYFITSNKDIPLNDREPGSIAAVALTQLTAYQKAAKSWHYREECRDGRELIACDYCGQSLWFVLDEVGMPYTYTYEECQALTVAHIRQVHSEVAA